MRLSSVLLCAAFLSCQSSPQPRPGDAAAASQPETKPEAPPAASIDESAMDKSVDPCTDFYQYACGGWMKRTPIPDDKSVWSRGFQEVAQRNEATLHELLEGYLAGRHDDANPFWEKARDYYGACMDEDTAAANGLAELKKELAAIDGVRDAKTLAKTVARLHTRGARAFFSFNPEQDYKDATQMIGAADQGGLGLPDRDYYLKQDKREAELRRTYEAHVAAMLKLAAIPEPEKAAHTVLALETALAQHAMDKVERRDPVKVYHRLERKGLAERAPHFQWDVYFKELGTPDVQAINVKAPAFFEGLDRIVTAHAPDELRTYLKWRAIQRAGHLLSKEFAAESFRLAQALTGQKADLPRWKKCVAATDLALGEATGRSFVAKALGDDGKRQAKEMIEGIEGAFRANLDTVAWMDAPAKEASRGKVAKLFNMVGYPDKWRDYAKLEVTKDDYYANAMAAARFEKHRKLSQIGKPVDRAEWGMTPPTVNAYYEPSLNEMVFPAGIMQPPYFKVGAPDAANYGGLGMVMGHELTHGFDDEGRQFDADGNFHEWWSEKTNGAFKERAECVAKQYDGYVAVEDVHLNGHLTLGENIADIGGLKMAHAAWRGKAGNVSQADEQNFFVAFAQTWCANYRPQAAMLRAKTDVHSTAQWRVNGPAQDNPDFEKAFSCKAGSPMAPANRCTVW